MQCPKCNVEMDEVRKLDVVIDACSRCGGIWLDRGELEKLRSVSNEHVAYRDEHDHRYSKQHYGGNYQLGHKKKKKTIFDIFEIFD